MIKNINFYLVFLLCFFSNAVFASGTKMQKLLSENNAFDVFLLEKDFASHDKLGNLKLDLVLNLKNLYKRHKKIQLISYSFDENNNKIQHYSSSINLKRKNLKHKLISIDLQNFNENRILYLEFLDSKKHRLAHFQQFLNVDAVVTPICDEHIKQEDHFMRDSLENIMQDIFAFTQTSFIKEASHSNSYEGFSNLFFSFPENIFENIDTQKLKANDIEEKDLLQTKSYTIN